MVLKVRGDGSNWDVLRDVSAGAKDIGGHADLSWTQR